MLYLKHGQTNEIDNLQLIYNTHMTERKSLDSFYEHINEHMKTYPPSSTKIESTTKNLLAIKQKLIKDFESRAFKTSSSIFLYHQKKSRKASFFFNLEKFCLNCNTPVRSLRADAHTKLFYSQGVSNKQIKAYHQRMSNVR